MRLLLATLSVIVLAAPLACSGNKNDSDPWASNEGKGSAPKTEGFGETDFQGPLRRDQRGPGQGQGPHDRVGSDLSGPEDCDNTIDDDGDGKVDCDDNDCASDDGCIDDPSFDESIARASPERLTAVSKLLEGGEVGMRAPDFRLPRIGRSGHDSLADLRGYVVVLNFWASWCAPCRKEVPALELTWQLYRDKHVVVIGVSIDDKKSAAEDFLGSFPVSYPILHDREGKVAAEKWGVKSVPTLILIDAGGEIRERHQGYSPALMRKTVVTIDELLEE